MPASLGVNMPSPHGAPPDASLDRAVARSRNGASPRVVWLQETGTRDLHLVGGKGASLGDLTKIGMPVPPGFVVTTEAFREFVLANRLRDTLARLHSAADVNNPESLAATAAGMQQAVLGAPMSPRLKTEIEHAYSELGGGPVAVRSSATAEDSAAASFAGQQRTFLGVRGAYDVAAAVQKCWASLYEERALFYRATMGYNVLEAEMAVPVQRTVPAEVSGVLFTADPSTGSRDTVLIEAVYGLGEMLVSGELSPDSYTVDARSLAVVGKQVAAQEQMLCMAEDGHSQETWTVHKTVPPERRSAAKLTDEVISCLARLGLKIESHYGRPQDIEWAFSGGELYILQARPITGIQPQAVTLNGRSPLDPVIQGRPASPGVAAGRPRVIDDKLCLSSFRPGEVLVAGMTTPDFVPAMKRAAAVVTDRGGRTCHAAIVSREMGVPSVVGAGNATQRAGRYDMVTVDGSTGKVFAGDVVSALPGAHAERTASGEHKTRTKLYVNLADPDSAEKTASRHVDGVGLLRAEFMIAHAVGEHPRSMLEAGRSEDFVSLLQSGLSKFAQAFAPRPVVFRFSDFKSNEYRGLLGGERFEASEENPMIGYRGCSRYLAEPELFALEAEAVRRTRESHANLWVMLPFVRRVSDLKQALALLETNGLPRHEQFKVWMMAELCSNVLLLDEFLDTGVDGVSIGSNDLTQLILGVDRDSEKIADVFDERDPAVLKAIESLVRGCVRRGVSISICGQAPAVHPELVPLLVSWGITSISVTPDAVDTVRTAIYEAERAGAGAKNSN